MDREFFQLAKEILISTLEQPAAQRAAHLQRVCGKRTDLLAEVQSLLAQQEAPSTLVDGGVVQVNRRLPEHIGPYEVVEILGEGGMGVVYRGRQTVPIKREVAIKVLHVGMNTARILERFAWERRSLARMNHPYIASILDAGSNDDGHPYVVLELIEGTPITDWCREKKGTVAEQLAMMEKVCQAVQHAHDRGILHRDLKPGNILVREIDGQPTPCIIDFGIAKALDDTHTGEANPELTIEGQRVGTPAYMSPEQLTGNSRDVDVRTDVYALGVILYELLSGQRPFDDEHLARSNHRTDPPLPSLAGGKRHLRGDLDNICLMAIRPEADRRYRSAADFASDLTRHQQGHPVLASPDSWHYRAKKTMQRHPVLVALGIALLVFTLVGVGSLGFHAQRLNTERDRALLAESTARQEARAAEDIATFLENLFIDMDPIEDGQAPTTALELLDQGADRLEGELNAQPANRGRLWGVMGRVNQNIARHDMAEVQLRRSLLAYAEIADTNATVAERAEAFRMLAICLHDLGRYAESETAFRHNLDLYRRVEPEVDVTLIQIVTDLATAIQAQGRLIEAQDLMQEAIAMGESLGEAGDAEVAYIRNIRGYILYKRGHYKEGLADVSAALVTMRRLRPGDNMDLVSSLNNVGGLNLELGRYGAAKAHIVESKEMLERIFQGEEHPAITRALVHLGRIALATGDSTGAVAYFETAHDQSVRQLGPDNPSTWRTRESLAQARQLQGRSREAQALYREVTAKWENKLGPLNGKTLACRHKLARFLIESQSWAAAETELQMVITGYENAFESDHPRLHEARVDLAEVMLHRGDTNQARIMLQQAVPVLERVYGGEFALCLRARELLVRAG